MISESIIFEVIGLPCHKPVWIYMIKATTPNYSAGNCGMDFSSSETETFQKISNFSYITTSLGDISFYKLENKNPDLQKSSKTI